MIAHEYFHNWTGNRITCRDWFQLCLKEGLTVFRDQDFSADMRSKAVKRIADVKLLKAHQFPEDAGPRWLIPFARAPTTKSTTSITATVYEKGAEVVRMLKTLLGDDAFRSGLDFYFERHDGEATTIEAFLACFEEAALADLSQFALWYEQAGTPVVSVETEHDPVQRTFSVSLSQEIPPIPGQKTTKPSLIPLRFGLIAQNGQDMVLSEHQGAEISGDVLLLKDRQQHVTFKNISEAPTLSLLRGFSAPVRLSHNAGTDELLFLAQHDGDTFQPLAGGSNSGHAGSAPPQRPPQRGK